MIGTNLWYLVGSFSQEDLSLETAPCPNPEMMANIELKFCVSLHCLAILINCLIILILLVELFSLTISPIAHIISLLTSSANRPITSSSHVFHESWIYETWLCSHEICRLFWSAPNGFSFKNQTRLQNANIPVFLIEKIILSRKNNSNRKFRIDENMWWARTERRGAIFWFFQFIQVIYVFCGFNLTENGKIFNHKLSWDFNRIQIQQVNQRFFDYGSDFVF